jgi:hypothetical protein
MNGKRAVRCGGVLVESFDHSIHSLNQRKGQSTVVSGQINPDWDCLQANHMWISSKADNLICSFVLEP